MPDSVACDRCEGGQFVDTNGARWTCSQCRGTGRIIKAAMSTADQARVLRAVANELEEQETIPHGPAADEEQRAAAGAACLKLCENDRGRAVTLWKLVEGELGYMPAAAAFALARAANTLNLVIDVEAPAL